MLRAERLYEHVREVRLQARRAVGFCDARPEWRDYANDSLFREIQPDTKIVIQHVSQPRFMLTVTLSPRGDKTYLAWVQEFETAQLAAKDAPFASPPTSRTSTGLRRCSRKDS